MPRQSVIDLRTCGELLNQAHANCIALSAQAAQPQPHWDALANSFASLSAAFGWGTLFLGLVAVIAGIAWGTHVKSVAEQEAREAARKCANESIGSWLTDQAPQIVRAHVELLQQQAPPATTEAANASADALGTRA